MQGDRASRQLERSAGAKTVESANTSRVDRGLNDPRAVHILAAEHWSLLSARNLGYQEMFGRATIFVAILSGTIIALALVAQATRFGRETLLVALLLLTVALFIGLMTFVRSVAINLEDARWVEGMNLLHQAYFEIVPELQPYFITGHAPDVNGDSLAHGSPQRTRNLVRSLTTTPGVVAALNSLLAGTLVSDVGALAGVRLVVVAIIGAAVSVVSAVGHVRFAARFRRTHGTTSPPTKAF